MKFLRQWLGDACLGLAKAVGAVKRPRQHRAFFFVDDQGGTAVTLLMQQILTRTFTRAL